MLKMGARIFLKQVPHMRVQLTTLYATKPQFAQAKVFDMGIEVVYNLIPEVVYNVILPSRVCFFQNSF